MFVFIAIVLERVFTVRDPLPELKQNAFSPPIAIRSGDKVYSILREFENSLDSFAQCPRKHLVLHREFLSQFTIANLVTPLLDSPTLVEIVDLDGTNQNFQIKVAEHRAAEVKVIKVEGKRRQKSSEDGAAIAEFRLARAGDLLFTYRMEGGHLDMEANRKQPLQKDEESESSVSKLNLAGEFSKGHVESEDTETFGRIIQ